jgi:hypothetical protein
MNEKNSAKRDNNKEPNRKLENGELTKSNKKFN